MSRYVHPWRRSIEEGKLKILLNLFERRIGELDEYVIVRKRNLSHPYLVRDPNRSVIGEVILNVPSDVIKVLDQYEHIKIENIRVIERARLGNGEYIDVYVYVWINDDIHKKGEEFSTLIPRYYVIHR
jgi:gamma-glutamylcyclotransferase (GGCT)/AIG2-like uncharacterized protein YtfP